MFINSRLRHAFIQVAPNKNDPDRDPKIYIPATQQLISIAHALNCDDTSCFGSGHRGDRQLKRLVKWHKDEFAPESRMLVYEWLKARGVPIKPPGKRFFELGIF